MLNSHDPSFSAVSLALHVTDVKPTAYVSPDISTVPEPSSHIMLAAGIEPSTVSLADGNGDHVTLATAIPAYSIHGSNSAWTCNSWSFIVCMKKKKFISY